MFKIERFLTIAISLFLSAILSLTLAGGCGGGGSSGGGTEGASTALEIKAPISDPPIVIGGEQTTVTISAYVSGSAVELYKVDGSNLTKIGDMTDDGKNGDQTAGDKVYTIQTIVNEPTANSITFRISASANNTQCTKDIPISAAQVQSLTSDAEFNRTAEELYAKTLETQNLFINFDKIPPTVYKDIGNNLLEMFANSRQSQDRI